MKCHAIAQTELPPPYNEELVTNVAGEDLQTHLAENQEFDKNAAFVALQADLRRNQKQEKNVHFDSIQSAEKLVQMEDSTESTTVALDDSKWVVSNNIRRITLHARVLNTFIVSQY